MTHPGRHLPLVALLLLAGCTTHHYLVVRDQAELHAGPEGGEVLARLPRYHHEALPGPPEQGSRVQVAFRGARGWVDRDAVRLLSYLDPDLDGGADRREVLGRELRAAQVEAEGAAWSSEARDAVKAGEVREGMTRDQVELAWGWPVTVEGGSRPGGQRWVYRIRREERVDRWVAQDPFAGSVTGGCSQSLWDEPWRSCWQPGWRWGGYRTYRGGWAEVRFPVVEERRVEFDAEGKVAQVDTRRYLEPA